MATDIIVPNRALIPASRITTPAVLDDTLTEADIEAVIGYARNAKSRNTQLAYASDWRAFCRWIESRDAEPLPCSPGLLCAYIATLRRLCTTTTPQATTARLASRQ
jgi:hypothetical protein